MRVHGPRRVWVIPLGCTRLGQFVPITATWNHLAVSDPARTFLIKATDVPLVVADRFFFPLALVWFPMCA